MTDWQFREAREAAALDRYWDRVIEGRVSPAADVAEEDAATIRAFQDFAQQPPDPAFLARLEDHLMLARQPDPSPAGLPADSLSAGAIFPPLPRPSSPTACPRRIRGISPILAIAAVALLILGAVFLTLRQQEQQSRPIHLSAVTANSTPEAATTETLLIVPLADAMEPGISPISGDRVTSWNLFTIEVAPETSATWDAKHAICCPGPRFEYVLEGTYRVRADAPMQIVRASNPDAPEVVPAGTEVTLEPGDARITRNTVPFEATTEDAPLRLLLGFLNIDKPYAGPMPLGWKTPDGAWESTDYPASTWTMVPADIADFQLHLQRVDLAAGDTYPMPDHAIGQLVVDDDPDVTLVKSGDFAMRNRTSVPLTIYALSLEPTPQ